MNTEQIDHSPEADYPQKEKKTKRTESSRQKYYRVLGSVAALLTGMISGQKALNSATNFDNTYLQNQQEFLDFYRLQVPNTVDAIQLAESNGGYAALRPIILGLNYNHNLSQLADANFEDPTEFRLAFNNNFGVSAELATQVDAQYQLSLTTEALAQYNLLSEAALIINKYAFGTPIAAMSSTDQDQLREILGRDFTALKEQLRTKYILNQRQLMANFEQVFATFPELTAVNLQVRTVRAVFSMLQNETYFTNPALADTYRWIQSEIDHFDNLLSPDVDSSYADLELWATTRILSPESYVLVQTMGIFSNNSRGERVQTGTETFALWQRDLESLTELEQNLDELQKQLETETAKSFAATLALWVIAIALATVVKFEKLTWSRHNWNRQERRKFNAISRPILKKEVKLLRGLLEKKGITAEAKLKLNQSLQLVQDMQRFLSQVAEQWETSDQPSATVEISYASQPVTTPSLDDQLPDDEMEAQLTDLSELLSQVQKSR